MWLRTWIEALTLRRFDRIDAVEQTDHGVLQRIQQGCRILFSLAIFRHQALDERAQLIGGGAGVEEPRQVRTALHVSKRMRNDSELLLDDIQARKLIVRLNEMIDDLAHVRLNQTDGAYVSLRRHAFEQLCEMLLELIEPLTNCVEAVIRADVGKRLLDSLGNFGETALEPFLIDCRKRV